VTQAPDTVAITWRKSSECANGECVEIAQRPGTVLLRRSDAPGVLEFTAAEWAVFVRALGRGEFDGPEEAAATDEPRTELAAR
jgi:hypothetical protein